MSKWTKIEYDDIEVDGDELNICLGSDDYGNNYAIVKISDILQAIDDGESKDFLKSLEAFLKSLEVK